MSAACRARVGATNTTKRLLLLAAAIAFVPRPALGNGIIVSDTVDEQARRRAPRPVICYTPLGIKSQRVDVTINDAVAETQIEQVFVNRGSTPIEGTYLFPVAASAGIHQFSMTMNGRESGAELLDAEQARKIYESIVAKMRDPALLQFAGQSLIQARVFPIAPHGECRIKLSYTETMASDGGLSRYQFPLAQPGCSFQPIEQFSLRAVVRSERPIQSVFSPTHECTVDRRSEKEYVVGLEKPLAGPDEDVQIVVQRGDDAFGLTLLTQREGGGEDGFFMARITPNPSAVSDGSMPKNICFVLDTSGSMADDNKIAQARKALKFCITNLNPEDRFNIITFATDTRAFRKGWSAASESTKDDARQFIDRLNAVGGTDIDSALRKALELNPLATGADKTAGEPWRKNPYFVVFVTDGEPTVGVVDPNAIVANASEKNSGKAARLFCLGVGFKVNTHLLDRLADDNGGAREYVTPSEDLELKLSSFYTKLAHPVLAGLKLAFSGVSVHDVYPKALPDLFRGGELVVVGRYGGTPTGSTTIELSGEARGERKTFSYPCSFATEDRRSSFLPRVWAMRKIGYLLDEIRLKGDQMELRNEVIRLAKLYGILTPYTSYLIQEDEQLASRRGISPAGPRRMSRELNDAWSGRQRDMQEAREAQQDQVGAASVGASKSNSRMRLADNKKAAEAAGFVRDEYRDKGGGQLVNFIDSRTFYLENGRWVDAAYDGKSQTTKLALYSTEYYDFVARNPGVGRYLAQGERVIVAWKGLFVESAPDAN